MSVRSLSKVLPIKDSIIFEPTKKSEILWSKVLPIKDGEFVKVPGLGQLAKVAKSGMKIF